MRRVPTQAEAVLWAALRDNAVGARFRQQHVIDRFIVDFCCLRAKLVVEVDGGIHESTRARDAQRDRTLAGEGFKVLRVTNDEVLRNLPAVLARVREALAATRISH